MKRPWRAVFLMFGFIAFSAAAQEKPVPLWIYPHLGPKGELLEDMMSHPETWHRTLSVIEGIGVADHVLNRNLTDDQLKAFFAFLKEHRLKLQLEVGAVKPWGDTGEKTFAAETKMWDRFIANGAEIYGIAMDEPLVATLFNLKKPPSYAVEETAQFIKLVRSKYPAFVIGDIEPAPSFNQQQLISYFDALQKRLHDLQVKPLEFFRLDVDWMHFVHHTPQGRLGWEGVTAIEAALHQRHVPFSLIYWAADFGELDRAHKLTPMTWEEGVIYQAQGFKAAGGFPDEAVIESWVKIPDENIPENKAGTFMHSVLRFHDAFLKSP